MAIALPTSPLPNSVTPRPLDFGSWQEPALGGPVTRLDRLGNRFAMDVTTPQLRPEPDGRIWVSRLLQAIGGEVTYAFPQVGLSIGAPGASVVNGAGQAGASLLIRGLAPGYTIRDGQFFNVHGSTGRAYLHAAIADVVASAGGLATVAIWPMLRISPGDGSTVNLAAPIIQGRLLGNEKGWTLQRAGMRGLEFTVAEAR